MRKRVLISPVALGQPDWNMRLIPLELTKGRVKKSIGIDRKKSVSRQKEEELAEYYGWPNYWSGLHLQMYGILPGLSEKLNEKDKQSKRSSKEKVKYDPHLRGTREVIGYRIHSIDGDIGHLEDFIVEDSSWIFRVGRVKRDIIKE